MPVQPGVWGIDLGQCGLKAIRLQEIDGQLIATAFDYVEHPKILSQPDADPDQLTREALDKFLSRNNLRGDIVAISVPGQSGLARFVKLPPVEEKKIADIVRFEAKQQIPFNLEEVVWDYQKIGSGVVTDGFAMETEIGLFAMKRDMVSRYLQHFKDVGVEVHLVQMAPLALCNYVAYDLLGKEAVGGGEGGGDKNCVVALDIGTDSSNLVITDGDRIIWQRPIPLGGNHFTRALTKDLKLTFAKAEHLKRNATKSPDLKKILAALKPVLNDFVGEVQRSLGYFTNTHRDAHISYMVGLGNAFRLPGLQKFLSEKLQLEVRKLAKMERLEGDQVVTQQVYTENILTFAVAYGLALQGIKRARLLTNLLPAEIRVERLVRAKKPFAVAAAAALLLAAGGLALSYALEYRTYGDSRVKKAIEAADAASKRAEDAERKFQAAKKNANDEEAAVRTIVAGQFERDNWLQLYKFVSSAIPQPNGDETLKFQPPSDPNDPIPPVTIPDIPASAAQKYWGAKGKEAYREYLTRQIKGPAVKENGKEGGSDEFGRDIEYLIQFNIESVNSFYCDNLKNYWDAVLKGPKIRNVGGTSLICPPMADPNKGPEGTGWIVEVQGYTFHKEGESFVRNTLVENIARMGISSYRDGQTAPAGGTTGTTPAAPAAPAPGQAPGGQADEGPDLGPVINHISHVVLFNYDTSSAKGSPALLGQNTARDLALGNAAPSGGGGDMMGMRQQQQMMMRSMGGGSSMSGGAGMTGGTGGEQNAPTGPSRDAWSPLNPQSGGLAAAPTRGAGMTGAGGMSGMMAPGGGRTGSMRAGMMGGGSRMPPTMGGAGMRGMMPPTTGGAVTPPAGGAENDNAPKRTEFVILFVWKEPTPSDDLRGQTAASAAATGTTPAAGNSSSSKFKPRRIRSDRAKDKDKDKAQEKSQEKGKENEPQKDKDKDKDIGTDKNKDQNKDAGKDKDKDKDKSKDKDSKAG